MSISQPRYGVDKRSIANLLDGEPSYRVDQVWRALYGDCGPSSTWTTLPTTLRATLEEKLPSSLTELHASEADDGLTTKFLYEVDGGAREERRQGPQPGLRDLCVSNGRGPLRQGDLWAS